MPSGTRLLIGLFPDAEVRSAIAMHRDQSLWPRNAHFAPLPHLHLTLGYVDDSGELLYAPRLVAALSEVPVRGLKLVLDQSCTWIYKEATPTEKGKAISVFRPAPHDGLSDLHECVQRALQKAELRDDVRGWTPHITFARNSERAAYPALEPIPWFAGELRLVRSRFDGQFFRHEPLASFFATGDIRIAPVIRENLQRLC